ncbi:MAG TPA: ABC transporter permease, partial [Thermoanaerobaculia bacterium]|nr:ABC transporter permease [Thermoanaerobaculia bacterium]
MSDLLQDIRYGLRAIRKSPGFAAAVLLTLMIGIGANSAIFSVIDAVLLRPLPYSDPQRLVVAWTQFLQVGISENYFSIAEFQDLMKQNRSFERVAAYRSTVNLNLTGVAEPERLPSAMVTSDFFPILDVDAQAGRTFLQEDADSDRDVVVLSHGLWQRRFGSDPGVVGRTMSLDGKANVIVGVMP